MRSFLYWLKSTPAASTIKRTAMVVVARHGLKVPCAHVGAPANIPHHFILDELLEVRQHSRVQSYKHEGIQLACVQLACAWI